MAIEAVSDIKRAGVGAFQSSGGASISNATLSISIALQLQADITLSDANVTSTSKVMCQLAPNADWDADDLAEFEVFAVAATGQITFTITRPGPIVGDFLVLYTLG